MVNKRLIRSFSSPLQPVAKNVFFQWIALVASCAGTLLLCRMFADALSYSPSSPMFYISMIALCLMIRVASLRMAMRYGLKTSQSVKSQMRNLVFEKLCAIGPAYAARWSSSEITQLTTEGIEQLETYFGQYLPQLFFALLAPLTLFGIVSFLDLPSALVLLVCVPLIPASIIAVQKFAKRLLGRYWSKYTHLSDSFEENLQGLTTLKLYGADGRYHEKMNREAEEFRKITMRVLVMQLNSISVMDLVAYGGSALGMIVALGSYAAGHLSLFAMMAIILLSAEFFLPMRTLGSFFHISMNGSAAADKLFDLLDAPVQDGTDAVSNTREPLVLHVDRMSYAYPDSSARALEDISFSIEGNGLTGIAGESGSGKSTLAALLTRRLNSYKGNISFNEQDLDTLRRASLLESVGYLGSQPVLFKGTVRENLAAQAVSDNTMIDALKKTRLWEQIEARGGLDFLVEENGVNLSGGQKQRLAFARLLVHDFSTIILDEATSSVDALTEAQLVDLIGDLAKERQIIFITHRLVNLKNARRILVMKDAHLVEQGDHNSLMTLDGEYARLYRAQSELEAYVKTAEDESIPADMKKGETF